MNRIPTALLATLLALLLAPQATAGNSQWTTMTERGITTAEADLVDLRWTDDDNHTVVDVQKGGLALFSLELAMHDGDGGRLATAHKTQGSWLIVGHETRNSNPGPVGLKIHNVASLAAKLNCNGHPAEPVAPPEPITPAPCTAVFPEGSGLFLAEDGRSLEVQLPREEDGSPGAKLSWVGFNPQPEPPAIDGNVLSFIGENVHVEVG